MATRSIHILEGAKREPTLAQYVDALGYQIREAADRGELLHACAEDDLSLVIIDQLAAQALGPGGDPVIQELSEATDAHLIVVLQDPNARAWLYEHGASDYIFEPLVRTELALRIGAAVGPPTDTEDETTALLATEDDMVLGVLEPTFQKHDWTLIEIDSGRDVLELTASESPDIALIDAGLRFCNAYDYLEALEGRRQAPEVIVLTNGAPDAEVVRAFDLGAGDVIDRPYHPQVVYSRARRLLDRSGRQGGRR